MISPDSGMDSLDKENQDLVYTKEAQQDIKECLQYLLKEINMTASGFSEGWASGTLLEQPRIKQDKNTIRYFLSDKAGNRFLHITKKDLDNLRIFFNKKFGGGNQYLKELENIILKGDLGSPNNKGRPLESWANFTCTVNFTEENTKGFIQFSCDRPDPRFNYTIFKNTLYNIIIRKCLGTNIKIICTKEEFPKLEFSRKKLNIKISKSDVEETLKRIFPGMKIQEGQSVIIGKTNNTQKRSAMDQENDDVLSIFPSKKYKSDEKGFKNEELAKLEFPGFPERTDISVEWEAFEKGKATDSLNAVGLFADSIDQSIKNKALEQEDQNLEFTDNFENNSN